MVPWGKRAWETILQIVCSISGRNKFGEKRERWAVLGFSDIPLNWPKLSQQIDLYNVGWIPR